MKKTLCVIILILLGVMIYFGTKHGIFKMAYEKGTEYIHISKSNNDSKKTDDSGARVHKPKTQETGTDSKAEKEADQDIEKNQIIDKENEKYVNIVESQFSQVSGDYQWGINIYSDKITYHTKSYPVQSASVIKLFIMEYAYDSIQKGTLTIDSTIGKSTLKNLLSSMITVSDNNATNTLIDYFGMENINSFIKAQGYSDTKLERRMLDFQAKNAGKDNYTSVNDVLMFLNKIYNNKDKYPYSDMLNIMKSQKVSTKIRRNMPGGVTIANKTGELSDVENDVGIVFGKNSDFAIVFLCSSLNNTASARNAIASATRSIYDTVEKNK